MPTIKANKDEPLLKDTVAELIRIEQMANDTLDRLSKEKAALPKRINDEIARRVAAIDKQSKQTLKNLSEAAEAEAREKIEQAATDAERGAKAITAAFAKNREQWRAALFTQITGL